jgi:hypothetical protein
MGIGNGSRALIAPRTGHKKPNGVASVNAEGVEIDDEPSRRRLKIGFGEMKGANHEYDFDGAGRR